MDRRSMNGATPTVQASNVWFSYVKGQFALKGVSLSVEPGIICMVLGASGSGKSTFLKAVKGLIKPQQGTINVFGLEVTNGLSNNLRGELGRRVAYIPQNLGLVRNMTVLENTLTGALSRVGTLVSLVQAFPKHYLTEARQTLEALGIGHKLADKVYNLSGGERQRVAIARALMQQPQLVLADEFVSQLDPLTNREIMDIVIEIAKMGVTFMITSHEVELVSQYGDQAVFLQDGQKVYECPAREVKLDSIARLRGR